MYRKPGDWTCLGCNELIFARKSKCFKCNLSKGEQPTQTQKKKLETITNRRILQELEDQNEKIKQQKQQLLIEKENLERLKDEREKKQVKKEDGSCVICYDRPAEVILKKCNHFILCTVCSHTLTECPVCRTQYNPDIDIGKIYGC
jgi:hypothetical protein